MADWQTVHNDPNYPELPDPEIIPICGALNAAGFVTTSSCSGHGSRWAHVWFEHSSDARIESVIRFVRARERGDFRDFISVWQKEIDLDSCAWSVEVHVNDVYWDTPWEVALARTADACVCVAEAIRDWAKTEPPAPDQNDHIGNVICRNPGKS